MNRSTAASVLSVSAMVLLSTCGGPRPTVISGTLLGHDGKPMPTAGVRVSQWSTRDLPDDRQSGVVFQNVAAGSFTIETFETGLLAVRFVGTYHEHHDIPVDADTAVHVEMEVRLGTSEYPGELERVLVLGSFNDYNSATAVELRRQPDGLFAAEIETSDSLVSYLIGESQPGRTVYTNGTDSEEFKYGPRGYESVVRPLNGEVVIVFDPAKPSQLEREAEVVFPSPEGFPARFASLHDDLEKVIEAHQDAAAKECENGSPSDWAQPIEYIRQRLESEQDPVLRRLLLFRLFEIADYDGDVSPELIERGLAEIAPTSLLWSFRASSMLDAVEYLARPQSMPADTFSAERLLAAIDSAESTNAVDAPATHVLRALTSHPDQNVKTELLSWLVWVAEEAGDTAKALHYYDRLASEHPDYYGLDYLKTVYAPDRSIAAGKEIPDFSVASLEDSSVFLARADLLGTVYLIDFWATWCAPCIAELPNVHEAFEKYEDRGFQILSVAMNDRKEDIADFRRNQQPMPWLHAFHDWEDDAVAPFEVQGIPRAILVDADGVILASDSECRGDRLHETLERVLGHGN